LQSINGVASVEAAGGQVREIEVVLDQDRLRYYRLTLRDVADQLAAENVNIAAGNITSPNFDVMARTDGRFSSPDEIGDILLTVPGTERRIRLHEIADVRDGFAEQTPFRSSEWHPGHAVVDLQAARGQRGSGGRCHQRPHGPARRIRFHAPDIQWEATRDGAYFVRGSVDAVATAAILGAVLAMIVVLAFLGSLRKSFVIGLSIPLAVLFTFVLMGLGGLTLNVISLGGLALGVGLLLDNAIVMLENISRHKDKLEKSSSRPPMTVPRR
jgi:multidrug efflux pump subunit AcrB